jgi:hypothetical protein
MQLACFQYGNPFSPVTSETVAQNLAQSFAEPADRILALAMALDVRLQGSSHPTLSRRRMQ